MKKRVGIVALSTISLVLIGCGGGGSSSLPTRPSASQMAKITKYNSKKITNSSLNSALDANKINSLDNYLYENSSSKNFRLISGNMHRLYKSTGECIEGDSNEEGNENEAKVIYRNCLLSDGTILNGRAYATKNDALIDVSFNNFTIKKDNVFIDIKSGHFITIGGDFPKTEHLYMDIKVGNKYLSYFNFNYNEQYNGLDNNLIINGYVKTWCTGGYVKVETKPQISNYKHNPNGELDISSNGKKVTINFKGDNVDFTDIDGNTTTYKLNDFKNMIENNCSANSN